MVYLLSTFWLHTNVPWDCAIDLQWDLRTCTGILIHSGYIICVGACVLTFMHMYKCISNYSSRSVCLCMHVCIMYAYLVCCIMCVSTYYYALDV